MFFSLYITSNKRISVAITFNLFSVGFETVIGLDRGQKVWAS
jgi:hypothetical protein